MSESWTPEGVERLPWFRELLGFVQAEIDRASASRTRQRPAVEQEIADIKSRRQGWLQSLGKPDLHPDARALVEGEMAAAAERLKELEDALAATNAAAKMSRTVVDPRAVADRLSRLSDVLSCENASRINVELARHIDTIRCFRDGSVVVRTCKLGALALESQTSELFADDPLAAAPSGARRGRPRKRGVRRLESEDAGPELRREAHWAADVNRFAGLSEDWFWEDEYHLPEPTFWSKEHALEVARLKIEGGGMTNDRLAEHFGVTVPTIRKALSHAVEQDPSLAQRLVKRIPRTRWEDSHFREVLNLKLEENLSVKALSERFGVSEPLIRKALALAETGGAVPGENGGQGVEREDKPS